MALGMRAETVCLLGPPVPQAREGPQVVPQNTKEEWCGHFRSGLMAGTSSPRGHLERQAEFHASTQDEA